MANRLHIEKGKPFTLPNGAEIRPSDDGLAPAVVTANEKQAEEEIEEVVSDPFDEEIAASTFQRTLADVTVSSKEFNPIMLILAYSMWGLDIHGIARLLNIEEDVVKDVMGSDLFTETRKEILESIRFAEQSSIHGYLSQKARKAAQKLSAALDSKSEDTRLSAANSILDRAGFRPADRVEHHHRFDDEMRIVYVDDKKPPNIEVELD